MYEITNVLYININSMVISNVVSLQIIKLGFDILTFQSALHGMQKFFMAKEAPLF